MSSTTIQIDYDVRVPMRDGVTLSADVYRPKDGRPAPVILVRTPYDNGVAGHEVTGNTAVPLAKNTLTFGGAAVAHFGDQPIDGVVCVP